MLLDGCYWTVVIGRLSAVELPCKVNNNSRRKVWKWCSGSFDHLQTGYECKHVNTIITHVLQIVLINFFEKDIW